MITLTFRDCIECGDPIGVTLQHAIEIDEGERELRCEEHN